MACTQTSGPAVTPTAPVTQAAPLPSATATETIPPPATPTTTVPATDTPEPPTETATALPTDTPQALQAVQLPDANAYTWQLVASGLVAPIGLAHAGDGSGRVFVIEQDGVIRILLNGDILQAPFLDIRDRVGRGGSEQGLLGLAFHPRFAENGYFYINYTDLNGDTAIARFSRSGEDPNQADAGSELRLLQAAQPYRNHNGGSVVFGPDGYLYLGLGDGGSAGDPLNNAQSLATRLGKILRIDVDGAQPYAFPPSNPFLNGGGLPEIWAYGLRNPWRFSYDRLTGDLYIGDVGQNQWEEIDFLPAGAPGGANFGWSYMEASHPYQGAIPAGTDLVAPVAEYAHTLGCSVTGGVVYRGERLPAWQGVYLFGDYCTGFVWGLVRNAQGAWQNELLFETGARITSFGEDESGEVYLVDHGGSIYTLVSK